VKVWCSEFGVLKTNAAEADRAAWLADVRATLEERGIPWTHWDYAGPFGLVEGERGKRVEDGKAIEALGLRVIPSAARNPLSDPSSLRSSG